MSYTGVINAPISIRDVQKALGEKANDVGRLCRSQKINKWARYKPVSNPSISIQQIWMHPIGTGFESSVSVAIDEPINIIQNNGLGLNFDLPSSGPYRLTDFNYYSPQAVCPIYFPKSFGSIENGTVPGFSISVDNQINAFNNGYNIELKDIINTTQFENYRLTAAIVQFQTENEWETATPIRYFYSEETWDSNTFNTPFEVICYGWSQMNLTPGNTYGVVMMLTESDYVREGTLTCNADAIHLQLENGCDRGTFTVTTEGSEVRLDNDFRVWSASFYGEDEIEMSDSPGVFYHKYQCWIDQIRVFPRSGGTYGIDPFSGYDMKITLELDPCLAILPNSEAADEDSSFGSRNFTLVDWFWLTTDNNNIGLTSDRGTLIIDISSILVNYVFLEKLQQSDAKRHVSFQLWLRRHDAGGNSFAEGAGGADITNTQEFVITDGELTISEKNWT